MKTSLAIEVEGLTKGYGEIVVLDGISFAVERGEVFGILGPNGSGKTTTVECLQGLRRRTAGGFRCWASTRSGRRMRSGGGSAHSCRNRRFPTA